MTTTHAGPGHSGRDPEPMPQSAPADNLAPEERRDPLLRALDQIASNMAHGRAEVALKAVALRVLCVATGDTVLILRDLAAEARSGDRRAAAAVITNQADALESALAAVEGRA